MNYNMLSIPLIVLGLLAAPARGQYRCFFGNLHAHTGYSDSYIHSSTPDTAYAYAKNIAHIDVQAVTDHNNGNYLLNDSLYQVTRSSADSMTVSGMFVALAGQEIGNMGYSGFGHINVFEATNLSPYYNTSGDLLNCYSWIGVQNLPAQLNHPGAGDNNNFNNLHYYQDYDQAIDLIEVLNSDYENERYYLQALANGWHVGATGNQDNHGPNWGNAVNDQGRIPLTGIWADTLTKASVLEALQSHRTTAVEVKPANDRIQLSLTIDGAWQGSAGLKYQGQASFIVTAFAPVSNFKTLYLYQNGSAVDSLAASSRSVEWIFTRQLDLGAQYFFAKAVQADNDRAWTSPVFFDVVARNSVTANSRNKVSTWPTPVRDQAKIIYLPIDGATSVKAKIFDLAGNIVWEESNSQPGQPMFWNVIDTKGNPAPNGIYIILLEQAGPSETRVYTGKTMVSR